MFHTELPPTDYGDEHTLKEFWFDSILKEHLRLSGNDVIEKFLSGKETWNEYISQYPDYDVDFTGVDFSKYREPGEKFDFSGYQYPKNGKVSFILTKFGDGDVDFSCSQFGDDNVSFSKAVFGSGEVNFQITDFGKKDTDFQATKFGSGNVYFYSSGFFDGRVTFTGSTFEEGDVDFTGATFKNTHTNFDYVNFGKGKISIANCRFSGGSVSFTKANFGKGIVIFNNTEFYDTGINFRYTSFDESSVYFNTTDFGCGKVDFSYCEFKGHVSFSELKNSNWISSFLLRHCSFEKTLNLSNNNFKCVPDLTNTKLTNQLSLDRMTCQPQANEKGRIDERDGERLCRLKELAEANKSHQQALYFHIMEMRAKRQQLTWPARLLDWAFDKVSIYGSSIALPSLFLLLLTFVYSRVYAHLSMTLNLTETPLESKEQMLNATLYSVSQVIPFVSNAKVSSTTSAKLLFGPEIPSWVHLISLSQGLISFIFLFLIGLGLRHRFRL